MSKVFPNSKSPKSDVSNYLENLDENMSHRQYMEKFCSKKVVKMNKNNSLEMKIEARMNNTKIDRVYQYMIFAYGYTTPSQSMYDMMGYVDMLKDSDEPEDRVSYLKLMKQFDDELKGKFLQSENCSGYANTDWSKIPSINSEEE